MKIAVIGAGKLGSKLVNSLVGGEHSITVIDINSDALNRIGQAYDVMTVHGDAREIEILIDHGIDSFDFLISTTNDDETNIVIASFAKELGCKRVIARVRDPEHMNQIEFIKGTMHIDYMVNPDLSITNEIYKYLVEKYTLTNGIFSSERVSMIQFNVKRYDKIIGLNMVEVAKIFPNMLIVAISRKGRVIIPHGDTEIQLDDTVFLIGETEEISSLYERVYERGKYNDVKKVMIIGGGKTGYYLASRLAEFGTQVKVVEISKERCYYLSSHLDNVLVLHGDATDISLLEEENLEEMDAFVTATGYDEENLLLSLIAKRKGVEDVITKVSRQSYKDLIESMGIEMAISPLDIVISDILAYILGNERIVSHHLVQGQAEIMEIVATGDMKITGHMLKDLKLPQGMLIAAIHRGENVIIPKGDSKIIAGDRVTIFYLLSDITELEKLFVTKKLIR